MAAPYRIDDWKFFLLRFSFFLNAKQIASHLVMYKLLLSNTFHLFSLLMLFPLQSHTLWLRVAYMKSVSAWKINSISRRNAEISFLLKIQIIFMIFLLRHIVKRLHFITKWRNWLLLKHFNLLRNALNIFRVSKCVWVFTQFCCNSCQFITTGHPFNRLLILQFLDWILQLAIVQLPIETDQMD